MVSTKWRLAGGVIALIGSAAGQLAQYVVAPAHLSGGTAAEQVDALAGHSERMQVAVWLDVPILLLIPAALYLGWLGQARRSRLAATGAGLTFVSALGIGYLFAADLLIHLAAQAEDRDGAVALVDAFQTSAVFNTAVLTGVLGTTVGLVLTGIALVRAKTVPAWVGIAVAAAPVLTIVGEAGGVGAVAITAYVLQLLGFAGCAVTLVQLAGREAATAASMTPAAA
ncbi:hypothetical protein ACFPIJ_32160 [Dactylosporangium cerinum]|uniref:DUF4386 family protein n=1 Tax=Dactylosporangium cerinum TaxID=1434730 RepID=A0ABV9W590_9ACTN